MLLFSCKSEVYKVCYIIYMSTLVSHLKVKNLFVLSYNRHYQIVLVIDVAVSQTIEIFIKNSIISGINNDFIW